MATAKITLSLSSTSPSYTTRKVTAKLYYYGNGISFNNDGRPWKISATGKDSVSGKDSFTTSTSAQLLGSATFTWTRDRSETTKTISATYSTGTSLGTLKCSTTITIPAKPSYTVKYNANRGTDAPSSQTKYYGETLTLRTGKPTRTGHTFKNWNTSSGGTGTTYDPGDSYKTNAAVTLYAQWDINTYKVTYKNVTNKGSTDTSVKTGIKYGSSYKLITPSGVDGYKFTGWKNDSTGTIYDAGDTVTVKSNLSYTALWELNTTQFKIGNKIVNQKFNSVVNTSLTDAFINYVNAFNIHDTTFKGLINSSSKEKLTDSKGKLISSSLFYQDSSGVWKYKGTLSSVTVEYSYEYNTHTIYYYYLDSNKQPKYFSHVGVQGTPVRFTSYFPNIDSYKFSGYYKNINSIPKDKNNFTFIDTYTTPALLSQNGFVSSVVISDKSQIFSAVYIPSNPNNTVYNMSSCARTTFNGAEAFMSDDKLYIDESGDISSDIVDDSGQFICGYIKYKSSYSSSSRGLYDIKHNLLNTSEFKGIKQGNININIDGDELIYKTIFTGTDVYIKFSTTKEYNVNKSYYIDCQITDAVNDLGYPISPTILTLLVPAVKIVIDINKDKNIICFGGEAPDNESDDMALFKFPLVIRGNDATCSYTGHILSISTDINDIKSGMYLVVDDDIKITKQNFNNSINLNKGDIVTVINTNNYISIKIDRSNETIIYKSIPC